MPNHPNRSGASRSRNPDPTEVRALREEAGLTQAQAATLIHSTARAFEKWEKPKGHADHRRMHPGLWELFRIKARPHQLRRTSPAPLER